MDADCLLVGCGADELIDLLMRVVLDPDDVIVNTPPTFGMYAFDCAVNAGRVVDVPRGDASEGFRVDVEGCKRAVLENDAKLLFLTSPNNPDGSVMRDDDLDELLKLPCAMRPSTGVVSTWLLCPRVNLHEDFCEFRALDIPASAGRLPSRRASPRRRPR